jgi:hypothetical protein
MPSGHSPVSEGHPPPFPTSLLHLDGRAHIIAQSQLSRTQNLREFRRHVGMLQRLLFRAAVLSGVLTGGNHRVGLGVLILCISQVSIED